MKRMLAGLALTTAAALMTSSPALAAPADPVKALKSQFATGKGVKFTERTTLTNRGERFVFLRRSGSFAFGKSGLAASDITGRLSLRESDLDEEAPDELRALTKEERTIRVGTTSYISGGLLGTFLPEDKTWFKAPKGPTGGVFGPFGQLVNIVEPATLKTLLAKGKASGSTYSGKITFAELAKVSPWFRATMERPTGKSGKTVVSWKLTVGGNRLAQRLVTTFPSSALMPKDKGTTSVDTRFTSWGTAVVIAAPPAEEVATKLNNGEDEVPEITKLVD